MNYDTAYVDWIPDRRDSIAGYNVYSLLDSMGTPVQLNSSLIKDLGATVRIPKSCRFLMVGAETEKGAKMQYGLPVRIPAQPFDGPLAIPDYLSDVRNADTVHLTYVLREIGELRPDSVSIVGDWDRNNSLTRNTERFPMTFTGGKWMFEKDIVISGLRTNSGYEFQVETYYNGNSHILPERGKWHTNINNRTKNDTYGFYVMNVASSTWRKAYIGQILAAFANQGYTGLFEDDCWYRIQNYGVDSYPPVPYYDRQWLDGLYEMMDSIKISIAPKPVYFNGLYTETSDTLLMHSDGGMTEGFACTHWSGLVGGSSWRNQCNRGLSAQHRFGKSWLALGGSTYNQTGDRW
jgi:hypothetical protein